MINPKYLLLIFLSVFAFLSIPLSNVFAQSKTQYGVKVTDLDGIPIFVSPTSILETKLSITGNKISLPENIEVIKTTEIVFPSNEYRIEKVEVDKVSKLITIIVTPFFQEWDGRLLTDKKALPIPNATIQLPEYPTVAQVASNAKGDFKLKIPSAIRLTPSTKIEVNGLEQPRKSIKLLTSSHLIIIRVAEEQIKSGILAYEGKSIQVLTTDKKVVANTRILIKEEPYFTNGLGIAFAKVPTSGKLDLEVFNHDVVKIETGDDENSFTVIVEEIIAVEELEKENFQSDPLVNEMDVEIGQVVKELEVQTDLIAEQNMKLRGQIERISNRLNAEKDLKPEQRTTLQQLLYSFQRRLYENEKAFDEAQLENQLVIERMQRVLRGQDSTNISLREQNLEERRRNAQLAKENEEFRNQLLFLTAGFVLVAVLAFIFYLVAKRDRQQKAKISEQAENLRALNHRITKQNEAITDSLRYAQTIQMAILPDIEKMKSVFSDFFMIYNPKDIVSGDFYWFAENNNKKFIAAVDCTGHGVPGAFMSMIGSTLLTRIVKQMNVEDTDQILDTLNQEIIHSLRQEEKVNDDGMDVCLCTIEEGEGQQYKITYTGAKRPLFYIEKGSRELNMQRGDVKSIGGLRNRNKQFTKTELYLNKGDSLFLSSDGLVDQHNPKKIKFGTKRLISFLEENSDLSMTDLGSKLETVLKNHQDSVSQRDDITFLGVRI